MCIYGEYGVCGMCPSTHVVEELHDVTKTIKLVCNYDNKTREITKEQYKCQKLTKNLQSK